MPSDSFSFAVLIGSYPNFFCSFYEFLQFIDDLEFIFTDFVSRGKIILDIDSERFLGKISDMTERSLYCKVFSEEFLYGFSFRR
jgi:hypothetical protein